MLDRIDPQFRPWLAMLAQFDLGDLEAARAVSAGEPSDGVIEASKGVVIEDRTVPGPAGAPDVGVRMYWPAGSQTVRPALLYMHGGGFVLGGLDSQHLNALELCARLNSLVISVDYRLAPENPYPAAVEDCYAVLEWTAANADLLGIERSRIGVCGESAGACLAAATCLVARDRHGPSICFQSLMAPVTDDRLETASMHEFTDAPGWRPRDAELSWQYYLNKSLPRLNTPGYAAPLRARDLRGLPPAHVLVFEIDPLRDEAVDFAMRLMASGVSTELHIFPRTFHGCSYIRTADVTQRVIDEQIGTLARALYHPKLSAPSFAESEPFASPHSEHRRADQEQL